MVHHRHQPNHEEVAHSTTKKTMSHTLSKKPGNNTKPPNRIRNFIYLVLVGVALFVSTRRQQPLQLSTGTARIKENEPPPSSTERIPAAEHTVNKHSPSQTTPPLLALPSLPPQSAEVPLISDIVLMGQFNFAQEPDDVLYWYAQWKRYFQHVVVFGPFANDTLRRMQHAAAVTESDVRSSIPTFHASDDDAGFYSPMINLARTLQLFKNDTSVKAVIYAHDDALLNMTYLLQVSEEVDESSHNNNAPVILASFDTTDPRQGLDSARRRKHVASESYSIHYNPHSTSVNDTKYYTKVNGQRFQDPKDLIASMKKWRHEECIYGLGSAIWNDTGSNNAHMKTYMEPLDDNSNSENKTEFLVPPSSHGGSDFLYISTSLADAFTEAAALFYRHEVFLECGFSKIIDILRHQHYAVVMDVSLCTKWGVWRDKASMLHRCSDEYVSKGKSMAMIHPYKLSTKKSRNDWAVAMEWASTNVSFAEYAKIHASRSEKG